MWFFVFCFFKRNGKFEHFAGSLDCSMDQKYLRIRQFYYWNWIELISIWPNYNPNTPLYRSPNDEPCWTSKWLLLFHFVFILLFNSLFAIFSISIFYFKPTNKRMLIFAVQISYSTTITTNISLWKNNLLFVL